MPKPQVAPLVGERISLRLLDELSLPLTLEWRNKVRIRSHLRTSRELSMEEHLLWYRSYAKRDTEFVFLVLQRERRDRAIGQVSIYDIDRAQGTAEFGRLMIGEDDVLQQGYGGEASAKAVEFAFGECGLQELRLEAYATNTRALSIYVALGFGIWDRHDDGLLQMRLRKCAEQRIQRE